jgi:hypothetical protein
VSWFGKLQGNGTVEVSSQSLLAAASQDTPVL